MIQKKRPSLKNNGISPLDLIGDAPLWKPRHPSGSCEMAILPVLFWLVAELRPALIVQLGLGQGTSFLGLCQAIKKAKTGGALLALPTYNETLSSDQVEQHVALYSRIAQIKGAGDFPEDLNNRPVQLLVLHHLTDKEEHAMWLPRLAENAVILTHFPATPAGEAHTIALLEALQKPTCRISLHCEDKSINILLIGAALPERIMRLSGNSLEAKATQALFQRLADGMQQQALARQRLAELSAATTSLKEAEAQVAALHSQLDGLQQEIDAAQQAEESEVTKVAILQAQLFDLMQNNKCLMQEKAAMAAALEEATQRTLEAESKSKKFTEEVKFINDHLFQREDALAEFATRCENLARNNIALDENMAQKQAEIFYLTQEAERLYDLAAAKQSHIDALYSSTSWKISAPIRKVKNGLLRLKVRVR